MLSMEPTKLELATKFILLAFAPEHVITCEYAPVADLAVPAPLSPEYAVILPEVKDETVNVTKYRLPLTVPAS